MAYTPIFDSLFSVDGVNLTDVAVFGAVWRYTQGELGKCIASPETIAERVGLSHNPVRLSLKKLCKIGLLTDLTPTVKYKAHEYIPTEKALKVIAGEPIEEPESKPEEPSLYNEGLPETGNLKQVTQEERLPETGNLKQVTQEERLPETGNQVTGIWQPRLPESGNEERINNDSIRESESPTRSHVRDPLADVLNLQGALTDKGNGIPEDQYFEYGNELLAIYQEMTGQYPDQVVKDQIPELEKAGITPEVWRQAWAECKLNWTGNGKVSIARVIEVSKAGGTWEKWRKSTFPDSKGRDSPQSDIGKVEIRTIKATDGGFNL